MDQRGRRARGGPGRRGCAGPASATGGAVEVVVVMAVLLAEGAVLHEAQEPEREDEGGDGDDDRGRGGGVDVVAGERVAVDLHQRRPAWSRSCWSAGRSVIGSANTCSVAIIEKSERHDERRRDDRDLDPPARSAISEAPSRRAASYMLGGDRLERGVDDDHVEADAAPQARCSRSRRSPAREDRIVGDVPAELVEDEVERADARAGRGSPTAATRSRRAPRTAGRSRSARSPWRACGASRAAARRAARGRASSGTSDEAVQADAARRDAMNSGSVSARA